MAVDIAATREITLAPGGDVDNDGVVDPGDTVTGKIRVTNNGTNNPADNATGVTVTDDTAGLTINPLSVQVTPIAFDDAFTITGNTPITFTAAQLLGNDIDPDGLESSLVVSGVSAGSNGLIVNNGNGTFTFTPTTGLDVGQTATFQYTITDAQTLASVTTGVVTTTIGNVVWYVDNTYGGENGASDGSYMKPFTQLTQLNGLTGDGTTNDDVDAAGEAIFVYHNGGNYTGGITLEASQSLYGDGTALLVNGHNIGGAERTGGADVATNSVIAQAAGTIVTLGSGNTVTGVTIGDGTGTATGLAGTGFGTVTVNGVVLNTGGQALSLNTGAFAGTGFTSTDSDSGTSNVALTAVTGTVALGSGALSGATGTGATGGSFLLSGGTASVNYSGSITTSTASVAMLNINGGHNTGTVLLTGSMNATNGTGAQFDNADGSYNLFGVGTLNGGDAGIDILNGSSGTFSFGQAGITTWTVTHAAAGDAFVVDATAGTPSFATVTYNGSITDSNGNAVLIDEHDGGGITFQNGSITSSGASAGGIDVTNNSGGLVTFNNATINLSTSGNTAVNLATNTGATIAFAPANGGSGLDIVTTSGTGFNATGGGTVTVADPADAATNSISTGTGTALNVVSTTIGAAGLTFVSIGANGAASGIILNATGTTGGLTVTGVGTTVGSGGTITNTTGAGVSLTSTANVSLNGMTISNTGGHGIAGTGVMNVGNSGTVNNSFSFTNGLLDSPGDGDNEQAIYFGTVGVANITGRLTLSGTTIQNFEDTGLYVLNQSGTVILNVTDTVFNNNSDTTGEEGISVEATGTANTTLNVTGTPTGLPTSGAYTSTTRFIDLEGGAINAFSQGSGILDLNITSVLVTGTGGPDNFPTPPAMTFSAEGSASTFRFDILNSRIDDSSGDGIFIGHEGTIEGRITGNTITNVATGDGIRIDTDTTGTSPSTILIANNTISNVGDDGIQILHRDGSKQMNLTIESNVISNTVSEGIRVFADEDTAAGGPDLNLSIINNSFSTIATNGFDYSIYVSSQDGGVEVNSHISGNTGLSVIASRGIFLGESLTAQTTNSAASAAALTAANGGVDVDESAGISYGVAVTVTQPTNPLMAVWVPDQAVLDETAQENTVLPVEAPDGGEGSPDQSSSGTDGGDSAPAADDGVLSEAELASLVDAAIARWEAAGASDEQLAAMRAVDVNVIDMIGVYLGSSGNGAINLDSDAAGHGWFVDATPGDDAEFVDGEATAEGGAAGKIDLLTVIMHELGHQIGLEDDYQTAHDDDLMYGYINTGERHLPGAEEVAAATGEAVSGVYALSPVSIGTLPAGKAVDVYFTATVDAVPAGVIVNPLGTATVSGGNFANVTATSTIVLDSLTLSDRVFLDADKDGAFDAGEGVNGVTLSLYVDGNQDGTPDGAAVATATTAGAGAAVGTYSFSGLAAGNYLVRVDASNFTGGGALVGRVATTNGGDPDNNIDNDSNAGTVGVNGSTAATITLSYNGETVADGTGQLDINNTLDFGFVAPNQAPTSTNVSGDNRTWTEGDSAVTIDVGTNATVADADSANFGGGTLTVAITGGLVAGQDQLGVQSDGQVTVGAGTITVGGNQIATFTGGGAGGGNLVFTFSSFATPAAVAELVQAVTFTNSGGTAPTAGARTVTWTLVDGDGTAFGGNDTLAITSTVTVVAVNSTPSISGFTGGTIAEFSPVGTVVGTASSSDPDGLTGHVFSLDDNAGGRFAINGSTGEVTVANRGALDFESDSSHDIVIRVTDPSTAFATSTRTITLTNAVEVYYDGPGDGAFTAPTNQNWLIFGEAGTDTLTGLTGDDTIVGGTGDDAMTGGLGNDTYHVDAAGDTITEASGEGTDRVAAENSYTLAAGVSIEQLDARDLSGTAALDLSGNEFAQTLTGNAGDNALDGGGAADFLIGYLGNDSLLGGAGNDILLGGAGDDAMDGGADNDVYYVEDLGDSVTEAAAGGYDRVATTISYTLSAGAEIELFEAITLTDTSPLNLTGNEFGQSIVGNAGVNTLDGAGGNDTLYSFTAADHLIGGDGDDILMGASGNDTMDGGVGNDLFYVDDAGDILVEAAGEGYDRVATSTSYTLSAGAAIDLFEAVTLGATDAFALTGNEFGQSIVGNAGANTLDGKGGNDVLFGYTGADTFVFTTALGPNNIDQIEDFSGVVGEGDKIALDDAIFAGLTPGALDAGQFVYGQNGLSSDPNDRIIYDSVSGALYYDADGSDSGAAAIQFAQLAGSPVLQPADFLII